VANRGGMRRATWFVRCATCGISAEHDYFAVCVSCGGALEVAYDYSDALGIGPAWLQGRPHTIWGYSDLLPTPLGSPTVSLGEGDTPLLRSHRVAASHHREVHWKNECANPTWSHKDRFQAVAATIARDMGFRGLAGTSTGNHGVSAAAYAAAAGLESIVLYPPDTPVSFLHLAGVYGGQAAVTAWDARASLLERIIERPGWCRVDGRNPFGIEGYKTIAYEIVRDLGFAPQLLFVPVGSGKLITGIWKGFDDLRALGLIDHVPRHVACQAAGVDVLSVPLQAGSTEVPTRSGVYTVALSTREPTADSRVLDIIRRTGGRVVTVSEGRIMKAAQRLGNEGLAAEPASVIPAAAAELMCEAGEISEDESSVCILTSSLTKTPDLLPELSQRRPWRLSVNGDELEDYLLAAGLADIRGNS
jgi:threonine synthase